MADYVATQQKQRGTVDIFTALSNTHPVAHLKGLPRRVLYYFPRKESTLHMMSLLEVGKFDCGNNGWFVGGGPRTPQSLKTPLHRTLLSWAHQKQAGQHQTRQDGEHEQKPVGRVQNADCSKNKKKNLL